MSDASPGRRLPGRAELAEGIGLAAAPTFAVMALAAAWSGGPAEAVCGPSARASPLDGMAAMYLLMSAFHLAAWLRRRDGGRPIDI